MVMETHTHQHLIGLEPMLSVEELAEYLHVPVTTIRDRRTDGKGPRAIKVAGRVRFATSDVLAWLDQQRESEPGHGSSGGRSSFLGVFSWGGL